MQTVSISYLRCLIEHVRRYILDRDIELVYYTIRNSSDVLTRDSMQLGAQVSFFYTLNNNLKIGGTNKIKKWNKKVFDMGQIFIKCMILKSQHISFFLIHIFNILFMCCNAQAFDKFKWCVCNWRKRKIIFFFLFAKPLPYYNVVMCVYIYTAQVFALLMLICVH